MIHPVLGYSGYSSYSGFLTVNNAYKSNLFFWFFEAKKDPRNAPIALWLQGGPGYSCFYGIFMENGPYYFDDCSTLQKRNNTWVNFMNVIYIDNPVGTGFSYTQNDNGYARYQSDILVNLLSALDQFFQLFPEYQKNDFYLIGESYGAKYAVTLAEAILNRVRKSLKTNLKGIILESGSVDPLSTDIPSYALQTSLIDWNVYETLLPYEAIGLTYAQQGDFTNAFLQGTVPLLTQFTVSSGLSQQFNILASDIPFSPAIAPFLERNDIRKALHVGNATLSDLLGTNTVYSSLIDDLLRSVKDKLPALFAKFRFLVYSGNLDIIVNAPSVEKYLNDLNYGNYTYVERKPYFNKGGGLIGWTKYVGNLLRVTFRGAGKLIYYSQFVFSIEISISPFYQRSHCPIR